MPQVSLIMIHIILKISVLLKIARILKRFLRSIISKNNYFFITYNDEQS